MYLPCFLFKSIPVHWLLVWNCILARPIISISISSIAEMIESHRNSYLASTNQYMQTYTIKHTQIKKRFICMCVSPVIFRQEKIKVRLRFTYFTRWEHITVCKMWLTGFQMCINFWTSFRFFDRSLLLLRAEANKSNMQLFLGLNWHLLVLCNTMCAIRVMTKHPLYSVYISMLLWAVLVMSQ